MYGDYILGVVDLTCYLDNYSMGNPGNMAGVRTTSTFLLSYEFRRSMEGASELAYLLLLSSRQPISLRNSYRENKDNFPLAPFLLSTCN